MHLKENIILEIILDALVDSLKMVPFLFLAYLLMEYIEHRASKKADNVLNSSKTGPFGSLAIEFSLSADFPLLLPTCTLVA